MSQISVFDMKGSKVSDLELNDKVFGIEPNAAVMHAMVVNYLANQATLVRALSEHLSGYTAALHSALSPEITATRLIKRKRDWL